MDGYWCLPPRSSASALPVGRDSGNPKADVLDVSNGWLADMLALDHQLGKVRGSMRSMIPLFLAAATVLVAGAAWACECGSWRSAAHQLSETEVAFVGRAVSTLPERGPGGREGNLVTEFVVTRTLKGPHRPVRRIAHYPGPEGGTCGVSFARSREVLVLTSASASRLYTSSCQQPRFPLGDYERAARR